MATPAERQPPRLPAEEVLTVLAVGPPGSDRQELQRIFGSSNWRLLEAATCAEARLRLQADPLGVVLCECTLADGCWKLVLEEISTVPRPPLLVVTSRNADDALWSEVLNQGGYDVLPQPYDAREVVRILGHAWLHWKSQRVMAAGH